MRNIFLGRGGIPNLAVRGNFPVPSVTPSMTPSITPSLTPSITPSLTPSSSPVVANDIFAETYTDTVGGWAIGPNENAQVAITRVVGVGPAGEDVQRATFATGGSSGGDFGFGHGEVFADAAFDYGQSVFFRFAVRVDSNGRFFEQGGTGILSGIGRLKYLIANDDSDGVTSRFILNMNVNRDPLSHYWYMGKGGGNDPVQTANFAVDNAWEFIQVELQYSSAAGVADGAYRLWRNNTVQGTPTIEAPNIVLNADSTPGSIKLGQYLNNGLYTDGTLVIDRTNFAIANTFTPGWNA